MNFIHEFFNYKVVDLENISKGSSNDPKLLDEKSPLSSRMKTIAMDIATSVYSFTSGAYGLVRFAFMDALYPPDIEGDARKDCGRLEEEIKSLKLRAKKFEDFVNAFPELQQLMVEQIEKYGKPVVHSNRQLSEEIKSALDLNNPIHKRGSLELDKLELESNFQEMIRFIERRKELSDCFLKYVHHAKQQGDYERNQNTFNPLTNRGVLLLTDRPWSEMSKNEQK